MLQEFPPLIPTNSVSPENLQVRRAIQAKQEAYTETAPKWHDVPGGAAGYRKMRHEGTNGFPPLILDPRATNLDINTRDGASIVLRKFEPKECDAKGTILHFHGGGWVINSAFTQDSYLARLADTLGLTVLSVDYRLAPEHPFPTPNHDCVDAALYVLGNDAFVRSFNDEPRLFFAGESAGAQLAITTILDLRDTHGVDVQRKVAGLSLSFGQYDLSGTPSMKNYTGKVFVTREDGYKYVEVYAKGVPDLKDPKISPLYAQDLTKLPCALFLVGTADIMLDDSVFMAAKWDLAGNGTLLKVIPEAAHGFTWFPVGDLSEEGIGELVSFIKRFL